MAKAKKILPAPRAKAPAKLPPRTPTIDVVRRLVRDMMQDAKGLDAAKRNEFYVARFKGKSLIELCYEQEAAQRAKDYIDLLANYANAQFDVLRLNLVPNKAEDEGVESANYAEIGRLTLTGDMYVSLPANKKEAFHKWLRANKLGSLIIESVNSSTLRAFVKERTQKGKKLPRGMLNVTPYTRASITKA